ncbi:hypothetical protein LCGC14_2983210 [marine sediment metagenome]|uniref:Uncharacterized protein n=1 Tax=marine sediment metagenome TaxID=412755 RepID=A0A0F8ZDG9_9ZZZZ
MSTNLDTLANCAQELLSVAEHLADTIYADQKGKKMPEPVERLIIVAGVLARIDAERPRKLGV